MKLKWSNVFMGMSIGGVIYSYFNHYSIIMCAILGLISYIIEDWDKEQEETK